MNTGEGPTLPREKVCVRCDTVLTTKARVPLCDSCRELVFNRKPTPQEQRIIDHVANGLTNKEIATETGLSEGTVKVYLSRIFVKFGYKSRYHLIAHQLKNRSRS